MHYLKLACFLIAITVASQRPAMGQNYVIRMKPLGQSPGSLTHVSEWQTSVRGADIILHWNCQEFQSVEQNSLRYDAKLSLNVVSANGPVLVSPTFDEDQTSIRNKDANAKVATSIAGVGHVRMRLNLELVDSFPASGEYVNTVELSVTGH